MKLEVGKLYICEEFFLMLYPSPETATADREGCGQWAGRAPSGAADAAYVAFWSERLGIAVSYTEKNIPLLVLNNKEKYIEVLVGDKSGWIIYKDWLKIKEIV